MNKQRKNLRTKNTHIHFQPLKLKRSLKLPCRLKSMCSVHVFRLLLLTFLVFYYLNLISFKKDNHKVKTNKYNNLFYIQSNFKYMIFRNFIFGLKFDQK